jgi:hypothetical protein
MHLTLFLSPRSLFFYFKKTPAILKIIYLFLIASTDNKKAVHNICGEI